MSRSRPRLVLVTSLACLALLFAATAGAQTRSPEENASSVRLEVTSLQTLVTPDDDLAVRVRVTNASRYDQDDLRVLATVYRAPIGRFNFQQAMDTGELGSVIHGFATDLGTVPARGARSVELTQSAAEIGLFRPATQEGVYPLRLQLLAAGEVVHEATTNLVFSSAEVSLPIAVSLLLPLTAPPSRDGLGIFSDEGLAEELAESGRLGGTMEMLAARPQTPITLALDALTLEEATDLSSGYILASNGEASTRAPDSRQAEHAGLFLERLRAVAAEHQTHLLAQPYAAADLVALERHDFPSEIGRHLPDGAQAVETITGDRPLDTIVWPPAGVNRPTLARMRGLGVRTLVLNERYVELPGPRGMRSPSPVRALQAGSNSATALIPDPWLEQTLTESDLEPALLAQRILGEIANVYFEVPGIEARGLLLAGMPHRPLDPDVVAPLIDALARAPFADLVTLATLSQRVEADEEPVTLHYPGEARIAELPASYIRDLARARRELGSLEGVLVEDQATPARFDRLLLQAASVHYRQDLSAGRALLDTVTGTVEELYGAVSVPEVPPVTLTSVEGQLPVTVRSSAEVPLRVLLHLRTPTYEIEGGPTRELVLEPDSAEILTFTVRSLRPGRTDGVQIVVTDPDEVIELAAGTVVVRSTAFSVVGLIVTIGAALFLLGWGVREAAARRSRRGAAEARPAREPAPRPVSPARER